MATGLNTPPPSTQSSGAMIFTVASMAEVRRRSGWNSPAGVRTGGWGWTEETMVAATSITDSSDTYTRAEDASARERERRKDSFCDGSCVVTFHTRQ